MMYHEKYKVSIPEGTLGAWTVEKFTVSKQHAELEAIRAICGGGRGVRAGTYTRLLRGNYLVMSDTPDEIRDHLGPISEVKIAVSRDQKPKCLVHGLGLGMVAKAMLDEGAGHVTVVEKSPEVIELVGGYLLSIYGDRLTIIEGDALTWNPERGSHWEVVWHDIWDDITPENLPDMTKLHRRFGSRSGWQGSWAKYLCQRRR